MQFRKFDHVFRDIYGMPGWNVHVGYGSFLTFEFGQPRLEIREPRQATFKVSLRLKRSLAQRHITIRGDWHLWIYCCDWYVCKGERIVGHSNTKRAAQRAATVLDGQKLVRYELAKRGARCIFEFDLGATLHTQPYDRISEQWMLYCPSGKVMTLRADRKFSFGPGDTPPDKTKWLPIPQSAK